MKTDSETVRWLCALKNRGSKFGVERMALFDAALGRPSRAVPCVHVAGSNGKGSTCAMLEAVFRAHGLRTGLYTSPHLVRLGERVQVNREPLADADIERHIAELRPVAARLGEICDDDAPSFFEFMTAMAFLEFQRRAVDIAVLETGLGGRLDATNIVTPCASVITSISLEHTEYLGGTLAEIAAEKGGIIKQGVPVALGLMPREAETVLRRIAAARAAPVFSVRETFLETGEPLPETQLSGEHQRANAALALLTCRILAGTAAAAAGAAAANAAAAAVDAAAAAKWHGRLARVAAAAMAATTDAAGEHATATDANAVAAGTHAAATAARFRFSETTARVALRDGVGWPARWQTLPLSRGRRLILDAAHNAECADALEPLLAALVRETGRRPAVITGVLGIERARPLLAVLARHASALHLVRPEQDRACSFEELERNIPATFSGPVHRARLDALFPAPGECVLGERDALAERASTGAERASGDFGAVIVAAGSVYLAGEILSRFLPDSPPPDHRLQDKLPAAA